MNVLPNHRREDSPWEEPESDATSRAALDRLLAEWAQPLTVRTAAPVQCPGCGRATGAHTTACDFSWLLLPQIADAS
jgi:hypothetical protein